MNSFFFHFQSLLLIIYLQLNQKRGRNEQWPVVCFTFNIYLNIYYYIVVILIFKSPCIKKFAWITSMWADDQS